MKKLLLSFVVAFTLAFGAGGLLLPATVSADSVSTARNAACEGVAGQTGAKCTSGGATLSKVVKYVLNILSIIAGVLAVVMIIISGVKYVTSGGDSQKVASAKTTLIYAIVGLIIVALSQFIVQFVLFTAQKK